MRWIGTSCVARRLTHFDAVFSGIIGDGLIRSRFWPDTSVDKSRAHTYVGSCSRPNPASFCPPINIVKTRMRRPTRPFTVEIKSSRKPISIRKPALVIPDRPRTEPLPRRLLFEEAHQGVQDRSPVQEA